MCEVDSRFLERLTFVPQFQEVYEKTPLLRHFVLSVNGSTVHKCNSIALNSSNTRYAQLLATKSSTLAMVTRR